MIYIKKIFIFLFIFLSFNTLEIDSNSDKRLYYETNNLYDKNYHTIYFINTNTNELNSALDKLNIEVLSYIIEDKKYYFKDINTLEQNITKDLNIEDKSYYYYNGIKIDGISVLCTTDELIKLNKEIDIY